LAGHDGAEGQAACIRPPVTALDAYGTVCALDTCTPRDGQEGDLVGMNLSGMSVCRGDVTSPPQAGNPDPRRFTIEQTVQIGACVVARVRYHGVANYEGMKVLLYQGVTELQLHTARSLDPHFCDDDHLSPFARFEPTASGWEAATVLAGRLRAVSSP
jgi:hypothetical protein